MSSTNKTAILQLNQYVSSDKPTMADYNADMLGIENAAALPRQVQDVIDGNFDVVSIGTAYNTPQSTGNYPIWDTWKWGAVDATCKIVRQKTQSVKGSINYAQFTWSSALNGTPGAYGLASYLERGTSALCNYPKLTLSFYAWASTSGLKLSANIQQCYGTGGAPTASEWMNEQTVTLTTSPTRYTLVFNTLPLSAKTFGTNNDDYLLLRFFLGGDLNNQSSGSVNFTQVQLDVGDRAAPYRNKSFAQTLQATQRLYVQSYPYGTATGTDTNAGSVYYTGVGTGSVVGNRPYSVRMRKTPTEKLWSVTGIADTVTGALTATTYAASANTGGASENNLSSYLNTSGTTNGEMYRFHFTADARY